MPGFSDRRVKLLFIALILSGLFIVAPWKEAQPEGAPRPNLVKGPNWGIDITGGSRVMLHLKATQATIDLPQNSVGYAENLQQRFSENLEAPVSIIWRENVKKTGNVTLEIGEYVSENVIESYLSEGETLINRKEEVSQRTQEKVKNSLKMRVDPYGTLGAQFKPMGGKNQFLQFEVALDLSYAKKLLGEEGLPEVFIDNKRAIWSEHIRNVDRGQSIRGEGWQVSFDLTDTGKRRFAYYTGGEPLPGKPQLEDKKGHPGVIYLDRPRGSVLLFTESFEDDIVGQATSLGGIQEGGYSESAHRFYFKTSPSQDIGGMLDTSHTFYIPVPAVRVSENEVSEENYVLSLKESEEIDTALLFGEKKDFSIIKNDNVYFNNKALPVENTALTNQESTVDWFTRVVGLESYPTLQPSITANMENLGRGLVISTGTGDEGRKEAEDLRIILSQRLPVEVDHISEIEIGARLGQEFIQEAAIAGIFAFAVVGVLVFSFYRKIKIVIPLLLTMACEVVITLGAASAVPDGLMSIGLPGLGGLIAVVGTGVDHQIIITDEVLGERFSKSGKLPFDRRTGRAFSVIFAAAATTIAAMISLAVFGFGAMRGFAIITLFGVLISVLITRPAYARIIGALLEREEGQN